MITQNNSSQVIERNSINQNIAVEVFRTNIEQAKEAKELLNILHARFHECSFNFDLDDCDRILRAKGVVSKQQIVSIMGVVDACGYHIETLQD